MTESIEPGKTESTKITMQRLTLDTPKKPAPAKKKNIFVILSFVFIGLELLLPLYLAFIAAIAAIIFAVVAMAKHKCKLSVLAMILSILSAIFLILTMIASYGLFAIIATLMGST